MRPLISLPAVVPTTPTGVLRLSGTGTRSVPIIARRATVALLALMMLIVALARDPDAAYGVALAGSEMQWPGAQFHGARAP
jgi:hypothetical protein